MDAEFRFDLAEIRSGIQSAQVIGLYFPLLRRTLLIDLRSNDADGPMLKVVPMAGSVEERFQSLKKLRPRFPRPESITLIPWPKYVVSLANLEILDLLRSRFANEGFPDLDRQLAAAYEELLAAERSEIRDAITGGESYRTLWDASTR